MKNSILDLARELEKASECNHLFGMYAVAKHQDEKGWKLNHWGDDSFNYCPFCGVSLEALKTMEPLRAETD